MQKVTAHADAFIVFSICAPQWNGVQQQCVPKPQASDQPFVMARGFYHPIAPVCMHQGNVQRQTHCWSFRVQSWLGRKQIQLIFLFLHICLLSLIKIGDYSQKLLQQLQIKQIKLFQKLRPAERQQSNSSHIHSLNSCTDEYLTTTPSKVGSSTQLMEPVFLEDYTAGAPRGRYD